jgi:hypothetical protein
MDGFLIEAADPDNSPIVVERRALARKLLRNGEKFSLGRTTLVFHEKVQRAGEGKELAADALPAEPPLTEASQQQGKAVVKGPPAKLICDSGPHAGSVFELVQGENTVGRSADNSISLPSDNQVSRKHCTIRLEGSTASIEDHGSTNGTTVNGARCQPGMAHPLAATDILTIGNHTYHLE